MLELPYVDVPDAPPTGVALVDYLERRLPQLLADARTLAEAGWDVGLTAGGVRMVPPDGTVSPGDPAETLPPLLDALGVKTAHRLPAGKTYAEIEAEAERCLSVLRDMFGSGPDADWTRWVFASMAEVDIPYTEEVKEQFIGHCYGIRWVLGLPFGKA